MPGLPYDFTYSVKDDYGNDFAHTADSDGEFVKGRSHTCGRFTNPSMRNSSELLHFFSGEYRTLLPDGRMQIVK